MFKFMIGSKIYYIEDKKVKEGYLYSVEHPILNVLHDNKIPVAPRIIIDLLFFLIDQAIDLYKKMEADVNSVLSTIPGQIRHRIPNPLGDAADLIGDILSNLLKPVDFRVLGLIGLKNLSGMSLTDLLSLLIVQCDIATQGIGDSTIVSKNIPGHRIFGTREEAEKHLGGSGLFCYICYKEFETFKEYLKSGFVCDTCKSNLTSFMNNIYDALNPFDYNGVKMLSASVTGDKHKKLPDPNEEGIDDNNVTRKESEKRFTKINDYIKEALLSNDTVFERIEPYDAGIFGKKMDVITKRFFFIRDTKDKDKTPIIPIYRNDKRLDMSKEVFRNYINYLDGKFDPDSVELMRDGSTNKNKYFDFVIPGFQSYDIIENKGEILDIVVNINNIPEPNLKAITKIEFRLYHSSNLLPGIIIKEIDNSVTIHRFIKNVSDKLYSMENEHVTIAFDTLQIGTYIIIGEIFYSDRISLKEFATFDITRESESNDVSFTTDVFGHLYENVYESEHRIYEDATTEPDNYVVNMELLIDDVSAGYVALPVDLNEFTPDDMNKVTMRYVATALDPITDTTTEYFIKEFSFNYLKIAKEVPNIEVFFALKTPKLGGNARYYIDNNNLEFIFNITGDRIIGYNQIVLEFFKRDTSGAYNAIDILPVETDYESIADWYGIGVNVEGRVKMDSLKLPESGDYLIIPHVNYTVGEAITGWHIGNDYPLSHMKLHLVNKATGAGDYNVTVSIDKNEIIELIDTYILKIKPDLEFEEDENKYAEFVIDYINRYLSFISTGICSGISIDGIKNLSIPTTQSDIEINAYFDYIIVEDKTTKKLIDLSDLINSNVLIDEINSKLSQNNPRYRNIRYSIKERVGKSTTTLFLEPYYVNASEIKLIVGQDVWHIEPIIPNGPIHTIHSGILTSIAFNDDITKYKYSQIEKYLLGTKSKTNILSNPLPHLTEYIPPKLPIDLLSERESDLDRTFNTFIEAKKNSMWIFCPMCFSVRKPQSDKKAKSLRQIYKNILDKTDDKAIELIKQSKATLSVKNTLDTYIDKSNQYQEAYKDMLNKVKKKHAEKNIGDGSLLDNQITIGKTNKTDYEKNKQTDPNIAGSTTAQDLINDESGFNNLSGNDVIDAELMMYDDIKKIDNSKFETRDIDITGKLNLVNSNIENKKNAYIDNKYKSVKSAIVDYRNDKEKDAYSFIADKLADFDIDILKLEIIFNDSVVSDTVKLCSKCQASILNFLTGPIKDILMYIKDLITLGYENISFQVNDYIDVEYYNQERKFVKFKYNMPLTQTEKDEIRKRVNRLFSEGF